jgi:hypothetical protein
MRVQRVAVYSIAAGLILSGSYIVEWVQTGRLTVDRYDVISILARATLVILGFVVSRRCIEQEARNRELRAAEISANAVLRRFNLRKRT